MTYKKTLVRKPISDPKHEAKETPMMEDYEHRTGKEAMDEMKRVGKKKFMRTLLRP